MPPGAELSPVIFRTTSDSVLASADPIAWRAPLTCSTACPPTADALHGGEVTGELTHGWLSADVGEGEELLA